MTSYFYHLNIFPKLIINLKKTKGQKSSSEPILWSKDHANIISEFTEELKSPKTMSYPDFAKPSVAYCDASEKGLGAVLYQEIDGKMKVISHASRTKHLKKRITICIVEN